MSSTTSAPTFGKEEVLSVRQMLKDNDEESGKGWDKAWQAGITPWDAKDGRPRAALKEAFEFRDDVLLPRHGYALVPGCGRGYDAAYLANLGLNTWGVDSSPSAITEAKKWAATLSSVPPTLEFKTADFFKFELPESLFTIVYDYTFFCAIPPSLRPGWALRMAEIIKPGGYLITLCFPMDGDRANGPPYSLSPELYETTLGDRKWKVIANFVPKESEESHKGRERLIIRERVET